MLYDLVRYIAAALVLVRRVRCYVCAHRLGEALMGRDFGGDFKEAFLAVSGQNLMQINL